MARQREVAIFWTIGVGSRRGGSRAGRWYPGPLQRRIVLAVLHCFPMKHAVAVCAGIFLWTLFLSAQQPPSVGKVEGIVRRAKTGEPIPNAEVTMVPAVTLSAAARPQAVPAVTKLKNYRHARIHYFKPNLKTVI